TLRVAPRVHSPSNNRPERNENCVTHVVGLKCYPCRRLLTVGGLRPPFSNRTPMLCIGYAKSASDEGFVSMDRNPSPVSHLTMRATLSHTRGAGKKETPLAPKGYHRMDIKDRTSTGERSA